MRNRTNIAGNAPTTVTVEQRPARRSVPGSLPSHLAIFPYWRETSQAVATLPLRGNGRAVPRSGPLSSRPPSGRDWRPHDLENRQARLQALETRLRAVLFDTHQP